MKLDVRDNNDIAFEVLSGYFQVNHITVRLQKERFDKVWKANTIRITFDTLSQCTVWIDLYTIKAQHDNVLNTTSLRQIIFLDENYDCIQVFQISKHSVGVWKRHPLPSIRIILIKIRWSLDNVNP